jgi:hypothetical protein
MSLFPASLFQSPPKRSLEVDSGINSAIQFLSSCSEVDEVAIKSSAFTGSEYTPPTNLALKPTTLQSARKVKFSNFTDWEYHSSPSPAPVKGLPLIRASRPQKSILKASKAIPLSSNYTTFATMEEMLEGTVQQLSGSDRSCRIDAYKSCLAFTHAFPPLELISAGSLVPALLDRISRDLHSTPTDSQICVPAMKCLSTLVKSLDQDDLPIMELLSSLIELSISMTQLNDVARILRHHHLFFLTQKFSKKLMTTDRCVRIITSLHHLHRQNNGSATLSLMLTLQRRFIDQYPTIMRAKVPEWIGVCFAGLLSGKADVRNQALELCVVAAQQFDASMTRPLEDFLNQRHGSGTFNDWFVKLLEDLVDKRGEQKDLKRAIMAPRIWSIIVLFMRSRFTQESQWTKFKPWLRLASKCFNSPDRQMKIEMITAWTRLVFATMPDASTIPEARRLLRAPIESMVVASRDFTAGVGRRILSTYYCLLYYSLRPTSTFEQLDVYWQEYVEHIMFKFKLQGGKPESKDQSNKSKSDVIQHQQLYHAGLILQTLLQSSCKWNDKRAVEPTLFQIDELVQLDPKWVRSRVQTVSKLVCHLLLVPESWRIEAPASNEGSSPETLAMSIWAAFMNSIKEAGSKEITVSQDLKTAITVITNSLRHIALSLAKMAESEEIGISAPLLFQSLLNTSLKILGESNFVDKTMVLNAETGDLEMANFVARKPEALRSPISHILVTYFDILKSSDEPNSDSIAVTIRELIQSAWKSMITTSLKLEVLVDFAGMLKNDLGLDSISRDVCEKMAECLVELAEETFREASESQNQHPTGKDFAAIRTIIKCLLPHLDQDQVPKDLYTQSVAAARRIGGDGAVLLAMTEPHSAMVIDLMGSRKVMTGSLLAYTRLVIENDFRSRNWGSIERGRKALWGGLATSSPKNPDLEYTNFTNLIETLCSGAASLSSADSDGFVKFIGALATYIARCPPASAHMLLQRVQPGLAALLTVTNRSQDYLVAVSLFFDSISSNGILALETLATNLHYHE